MNYGRHYEDVLRRAELFSYIVQLIKTCPDTDEATLETLPEAEGRLPAAAPLPPPTVSKFRELMPRISVVDRRVLCNGASIDLARRPLTLRLFEAFCSAPGFQLSREEVVHRLYQMDTATVRSERYLESAYANCVKLISRARILAAAFFSRSVEDSVEWFVYDQELRLWSLYRLRTEYLAVKLG